MQKNKNKTRTEKKVERGKDKQITGRQLHNLYAWFSMNSSCRLLLTTVKLGQHGIRKGSDEIQAIKKTFSSTTLNGFLRAIVSLCLLHLVFSPQASPGKAPWGETSMFPGRGNHLTAWKSLLIIHISHDVTKLHTTFGLSLSNSLTPVALHQMTLKGARESRDPTLASPTFSSRDTCSKVLRRQYL